MHRYPVFTNDSHKNHTLTHPRVWRKKDQTENLSQEENNNMSEEQKMSAVETPYETVSKEPKAEPQEQTAQKPEEKKIHNYSFSIPVINFDTSKLFKAFALVPIFAFIAVMNIFPVVINAHKGEWLLMAIYAIVDIVAIYLFIYHAVKTMKEFIMLLTVAQTEVYLAISASNRALIRQIEADNANSNR